MRRLRCPACSDGGQITVFVVVITAAAVMFTGLVLDGGLALASSGGNAEVCGDSAVPVNAVRVPTGTTVRRTRRTSVDWLTRSCL